ncbi:hypothetical protein ACIP9C_00015 [Lysinibacillus sp. NPDC093210]|uniref:hypothetical protein n=1 Tax=Lysinibacillus sp. NPDC093210 TaxID=3364133 RepID=UPI0037FBC606
MIKNTLVVKVVVVLSLVFSIIFASSLGLYRDIEASAKMQERQDLLQDLLIKSEEFNKKFDDASESVTKEFEENTKKLIFNDDISLNTNGELSLSDLDVKTSDEHNVVYLPIEYENVKSELNKSFFSIIFDKTGNLEYYVETKIVGNDVNYTAEVEVYNNGILAKKEYLQFDKEDFDSTLTEESISQNNIIFINPIKVSAGFWSEFNDCLASKGIAAWAITALSVACGLACIGTAGAGCIPCLLGAGLATEGVVAYCAFKVRANS